MSLVKSLIVNDACKTRECVGYLLEKLIISKSLIELCFYALELRCALLIARIIYHGGNLTYECLLS